jgi:serine/threonine protein kinase
VYRAIDNSSKEMVALKEIILHNEKNDGFPTTSIREIATLRMINHPNCVNLLDVVVSPSREGVFLVFEYCEHDLSALLHSVKEPFSESEVKSLAAQLLSAVAYLHEHWIIHRDIKLSNLLYNNKGEIKLADFGLARLYAYPKRSMTAKVVTLWYRAPELLLGDKSYTTGIDIWAVGCVLAELLLNRPLLAGDSEIDQVHRIFRLLGTPTPRIWPGVDQLPQVAKYAVNLTTEGAKYQYNNLRAVFPSISEEGFSLLNAMLTYDPSKRITVSFICTFR